MITGQTFWPKEPLPNRQRIQYDTTLQIEFSNNTEFGNPTVDNSGRPIMRIDRRDSLIVYYDENKQPSSRIRLDSLHRLLYSKPTNTLSTLAHQRAVAYQQHLTRQIDAVLVADPNARITRLPDRWFLSPTPPSGFAWALAVPLYGDVWPKKGSYWIRSPQQWQRILSHRPYMYLSQNLNWRVPFMLRASVFQWSDLTSFIWPLLLVTTLWGLFSLAMLMLITQWFREIFADLLNGEFFGERIARRVQQSGWLFIGGFVLKNGIDVFQPIFVQSYLQTHGFNSFGNWIWNGPDHWLWLCAGLVLLVFAQIFSYGTQLQRDSELTI